MVIWVRQLSHEAWLAGHRESETQRGRSLPQAIYVIFIQTREKKIV